MSAERPSPPHRSYTRSRTPSAPNQQVITLPPDTPPAGTPPADPPPADNRSAEQGSRPAAGRPPVPTRRTPPVDTARLLPEVSRDETDEGWGERPDRSDDDRFLDEVPPHHVG
jgi:hypothetical protein